MRILIVEDEQELCRQVADRLRQEGYIVDVANDGRVGDYYANEYPIKLAIVDLGLPDTGPNGMELVRRWRAAEKPMKIIILTARDQMQDVIEGLNAGANDYVKKPFALEELVMRVFVQLFPPDQVPDKQLRNGPIVMDLPTQRVTVNRRPVELTAMQHKLLLVLMSHTDQVLSQRRLIDLLYEGDDEPSPNTLVQHVKNTRQKLDPDSTLRPIETLEGRGYRLRRLVG